jgi:uncharacterized protein YukE
VANIDNSRIMVGDELEGAGPYIRGQAQAIMDELTKLKGMLAPLPDYWKSTNWGGHGPGAAQAYQDVQNEWDLSAQTLLGPDGVGVLGDIAHAMDVAWVNYGDAELANTRTWTR